MDETVETAYGTVEAAALRALQGRFPTADLVKAAEAIELQRLLLRDSLVRLHETARHLIDGAPATLAAQKPVCSTSIVSLGHSSQVLHPRAMDDSGHFDSLIVR
jgi:hypothetical protein